MKMNSRHIIVSLLMFCFMTQICCQQQDKQITDNNDTASIENDNTTDMLRTVLIKIICGPLTSFDRQLLHGEYFNYTDEQIYDFRKTGCPKKLRKKKKSKSKKLRNKNYHKTAEDYEILQNESKENTDDDDDDNDKSTNSQSKAIHIFKIFLNDSSNNDSLIDELKIDNSTVGLLNNTDSIKSVNEKLNSTDKQLNFEEEKQSSSTVAVNENIETSIASNFDDDSSSPTASILNETLIQQKLNNSNELVDVTELPVDRATLIVNYIINTSEKLSKNNLPVYDETTSSVISTTVSKIDNKIKNKTGIYAGLEWVGDDVYRVIPEALNYEVNNEDDADVGGINSSASKITDDYTDGYQSKEIGTSGYGLSRDQEATMAIRRFEQMKTLDRIKQRLLTLSGRDNSNGPKNSQILRQPLPMLFPICQVPDGADRETWFNSNYMNILFQMTLKSRNPIAETLLRIYVLPQPNLTQNNLQKNNITISVYSYTKPLTKNQAEKVLLDSVQTSLSSQGSHLVLNITKTDTQNNIESRFPMTILQYGLVIEVKNQHGILLKPRSFIENDSCNSTIIYNPDEKAYQRIPVLFVLQRTCSRYTRMKKGQEISYVKCGNGRKKNRH
ncbi:hypothetical protein HCN44_006763 [Aphidius gifuensis]|uniref:Uncharacterized protein n=1 Tax=Aphidius gifuensis TaxID=684658 RepID=A0A834Y355_APHGI|nr:uncharacterized protein LOC122849888 isoform X2 [Aphidius gifuensis]KAF7995656.1 hypothetical protein HCN44_006763 [Aphidius gifuensis]